jgi:hypothetical protein
VLTPFAAAEIGRPLAKSKSTRLREQRERQQEYRSEQKRLKRPDRDDVARVALRWLIVETNTRLANEPQRMTFMETVLLDELERLGFDRKQSDDVLEDLVDRYVKEGWDFRRKLHLEVAEADKADLDP